MYEDVVVEHLPQAQHSAISPAQSSKASVSHVPIRTRQRHQADRVGESRQPACRRAFIQLAVRSKRRRNPHLPGIQKHATAHKEALAGVMREGFTFISNLSKIRTLLFRSVLSMYSCEYPASGLFSWSMELVASSRQFAPKIVNISVRYIRISFYF